MPLLVLLIALAALAGDVTESPTTLAIDVEVVDNPWYALPDLSNPECVDLVPIPWCDGATIPILLKFFAGVGAPSAALDSKVADTISRYASCWIQLGSYSTCSQRMCFAAGVYPQQEDLSYPIMLVTVYQDHPTTKDTSYSEYELGPSFSFDLEPLTWEGPKERVENATPCQ